jgi:hypothetical protein
VRVTISMSAAASTPFYLAMIGAAAWSVTASRWEFTPAQTHGALRVTHVDLFGRRLRASTVPDKEPSIAARQQQSGRFALLRGVTSSLRRADRTSDISRPQPTNRRRRGCHVRSHPRTARASHVTALMAVSISAATASGCDT